MIIHLEKGIPAVVGQGKERNGLWSGVEWSLLLVCVGHCTGKDQEKNPVNEAEGEKEHFPPRIF